MGRIDELKLSPNYRDLRANVNWRSDEIVSFLDQCTANPSGWLTFIVLNGTKKWYKIMVIVWKYTKYHSYKIQYIQNTRLGVGMVVDPGFNLVLFNRWIISNLN